MEDSQVNCIQVKQMIHWVELIISSHVLTMAEYGEEGLGMSHIGLHT